MEEVILVDEQDQQIGAMEKMEAHKQGKLHRAFSVFVFNSNGDLLLQKRNKDKYHSGGKWTNTCCSHPKPEETTEEGAHRRLHEEMGMACELDYVFNFLYRADLDNELIEHELDHVFFGTSDRQPILNPLEAEDFKYINLKKLQVDMAKNPAAYTEWLKICLPYVIDHHQKYF